MANEIDLSADEGSGESAPGSTQEEGFQDDQNTAENKSSFWSNPKVKKYAPYFVAGGLLLILFIYMIAKKGNSTATTAAGTNTASYSPPPSNGSSGSSTDTTGLSTQLSQQYSQTQQQLTDLQNQINQENTLLTQMQQTAGQTYPTTGANTSIPITSVSSAVSSHTGGSGASSAKNYSTITVPSGLSQQQMNRIALANPGSPIVARNTTTGARTGYSISKAGANGQLYTANTYNAAVNKAGGQWLTNPNTGQHIDFKGQYTTTGRFVTSNPQQQALYDSIVKKNPSA